MDSKGLSTVVADLSETIQKLQNLEQRLLHETDRKYTEPDDQPETPTPNSKCPLLCAALHAAQTSSGRSALVAGFAYYELSRQSRENAYRVKEYPFLLLGAFTFAVCSSAFGAFAQMSGVSAPDGKLREMASIINPPGLIGGLVRWSFRLFKIAFLLYVVAMSYMVEVYNPVAVELSHNWGHIRLLVVAEFYAYIPIIVFYFVWTLWLCRLRGKALDLKPPFNDLDNDIDDDSRFSSLLTRLNVIGGRAMFMLGFFHHAHARYVYTPGGPYGGNMEHANADICVWLNAAFWHAIHFASWLLILAVLLTALMEVYMTDFFSCSAAVKSKFFDEVRFLWKTVHVCFKLGMYLCLISAGLVGWGCTQPCLQTIIPGGGCYADVAWVPALLCTLSLVCILVLRNFCRVISYRVHILERENSLFANEEYIDTVYTDRMQVISSLGSGATIAAGFVMYNIATFDTDVVEGPVNGPDKFGLTIFSHIFLWVDWIAFAAGITTALCATTLEEHYYGFTSPRAKSAFVERIGGLRYFVIMLFGVAILSFMLSFGMYGLAKLQHHQRVESMVVVVVGLFAVVFEIASVRDNYLKVSSTALCPTKQDIMKCSKFKPHLTKLQGELKDMTSRALLFGGFACNAVSFLFRPQALFAPTYTVCMGTCFVAAMYITIVDIVVNILILMLPCPVRREMLASFLSPVAKRIHTSSVLLLSFFLIALVIMGFVKLWIYGYENAPEPVQIGFSETYGWLQFLGGLVGLLGVGITVLTTRRTVKEVQQTDYHHTQRNPYRCLKFITILDMRANATTFQTGNVFYEILFSSINTNPGYAWLNFAYFGFSVMSLVLGTIGICFCGQFNYWVQQMESYTQKTHYAFLFRSSEKHLLFMYTGSIYCWLTAMLFSSAVKYPDIWYFSTSWAAFGLLMISFAIHHIHMLGAHFTMQDGWDSAEIHHNVEMQPHFIEMQPVSADNEPED